MSYAKKPATPAKMSDNYQGDSEESLRDFSEEDEFLAEQNAAREAAERTPSPPKEKPKTHADGDSTRLSQELEAARARIDTLARAYQEVERDKEEFKRRLQRERERMLDVEKGKISLLLIEAVDELALCLKNADESPLSVGVRMIRDNLLKKLRENGVVSIELEGTVFDPNFAEAVDLQRVDDPDDNMKILEVLSPGYVFKEQVIRPARVRVARHIPSDV